MATKKISNLIFKGNTSWSEYIDQRMLKQTWNSEWEKQTAIYTVKPGDLTTTIIIPQSTLNIGKIGVLATEKWFIISKCGWAPLSLARNIYSPRFYIDRNIKGEIETIRQLSNIGSVTLATASFEGGKKQQINDFNQFLNESETWAEYCKVNGCAHEKILAPSKKDNSELIEEYYKMCANRKELIEILDSKNPTEYTDDFLKSIKASPFEIYFFKSLASQNPTDSWARKVSNHGNYNAISDILAIQCCDMECDVNKDMPCFVTSDLSLITGWLNYLKNIKQTP